MDLAVFGNSMMHDAQAVIHNLWMYGIQAYTNVDVVEVE